MRKNIFGRQFKRDTNERKALFRSLLSELVLHERIQTTEEKAKAIRAAADRLITKAKKQDRLHAYALLQPLVTAHAVKKLVVDLGPRFVDRSGGYTRILRLQRRFSDNAKMAMIEWVEQKNHETKKMTSANLDMATSKPTKPAAKNVARRKETEEVKGTKKKKVKVISKKEEGV